MLRFLILLPFLILLIAFALSNPQPVPLGLWPTDYTVEVPVSLAILAAAGLFFFLGALFVWFGTVAARTRHRSAERRARALETELKAHKPPAPIVLGTGRPLPPRIALAAPK